MISVHLNSEGCVISVSLKTKRAVSGLCDFCQSVHCNCRTEQVCAEELLYE